MAQLKIDVIVDDHGAAQKLAGVEQGVKGVEKAAGASAAAVDKHSGAMATWSNSAKSFISSAASMYVALGADRLIGALAEGASEAFRMAGAISDLSSKSGLSAKVLQQLDFAGSQAGVSMEKFADAAFRLQIRLGEGKDKGLLRAVNELGLDFKTLLAASPDQQMMAVVGALSQVEDSSRRNQLGFELFGKSFATIAPAMTRGFMDLAAAANFAGDAQINALDAASDAWDRFVKNRKADFANMMGGLVLIAKGMADIGLVRSAETLMSKGMLGGTAALIGLGVVPSDQRGDIVLPASGVKGRTPTKTQAQLDAEEREAEKRAKERQAAAAKEAAEMARLSGRTAIEVADTWMGRVEKLGGITKLAAKDQESFNKALEESLDAMIRLNGTVDPATFNAWVNSMRVKVTQGLGGTIPGTAVTPPSATGFYGNLLPSPVAGFPGGLPGTAADMSNINPLANVGFMAQALGTNGQLGANLGAAIMSGLSGGISGIGSSLGSMFGGSILGQLGSQLSKSIGGMMGGMLGSVMGPLGSMLGGLIGPLFSKIGGGIAKLFGKGDDGDKERDVFLKEMGGFTALSERLHKELGSEGDSMFAALRSANSGKEITAAADKIKAALEAHAEAIKGAMETLPSAVNARSANITSQADFSTVGAEAMGTFSFLVQQGQSAIQAFNAIAPAIGAMRQAFADNNFEMSAASQRLFELGQIIEQNKVQFDNIAASGSILSAMTQANIKDFELFKAAASDVGLNLQTIIDRGVPTAQALAMAQPQLQALWEAQQKFGFATDETTQALIDQAVQQGIVGEGMRDVNQRILDVLIAIGDVLGATIPDALRGLPAAAGAAADGMNHAFGGIRPPSFMSRDDAQAWIDNPPDRDFTAMASGGATAGGRGGVTVYVDASGSLVHSDALSEQIADAVAPYLPGAVESYGV